MSIRGAVKKLIPRGLFRKVEPYGHLAEAVLFNVINGFPARNLKIIGVTGTNGKTTTAYMIHNMLHKAGYKVGLMTTIAYGVGDNVRPQELHMTTVPVPSLLRQIKQMKTQGMEWLVLETTSHALAQNRVWGFPYSIAVMTNVTHEHLDYHGTFERYLVAKLKLFKLTDRNRKGLRTGIINADDPSASLFAAAVSRPFRYGQTAGDLRATDVTLTPEGSTYTARAGGQTYQIQCKLPGSFNVSNSLAAVSAGHVLGLTKKKIEQGIASLEHIAGRMERVETGKNFSVIVDFAHTPAALENALRTLRAATKGRVMLVFGATGDRDKAKRPIMGRVAAEHADKIFLTDDETYTEDPDAIRRTVAEGIKQAGGADKYVEIGDRREAIKASLDEARKGDVILLAGIGHQDSRNMGGELVPWREAEVVKSLLVSTD